MKLRSKLAPVGKVSVDPATKKRRRARAALKKARALIEIYDDVEDAKTRGVTLDELRRLYIERQAKRSRRRRAA